MRSVFCLFLFLIQLNEIKPELWQGSVSWNLKCAWWSILLLLFINLFKCHLLTGSRSKCDKEARFGVLFTLEPFTGALVSFRCCHEASEVLDGCKFCSCTCCYIFLNRYVFHALQLKPVCLVCWKMINQQELFGVLEGRMRIWYILNCLNLCRISLHKGIEVSCVHLSYIFSSLF